MTAPAPASRDPVASVIEGLRSASPRVAAVGPYAWSFVLGSPPGSTGSARLANGWLLLSCDPGAPSPAPPAWDCLALSGRLPGPAKLVLDGSSGGLRMAAEIPLPGTTDLPGRLRTCFRGFVAGASWVAGGPPPGAADLAADAPPGASGAAAGPVPAIDLPALCSEAGWPSTPRDDASAAVDLEVGPSVLFRQAWIGRGDDLSVEITVPLLRTADLPPAGREALGVFLLAASGAVRMVRAAARPGDGGLEACFEVKFGGIPSPGELGTAFAACSVACDLFGQEAGALRDESLAREYLAVRGGSIATRSVCPPGAKGETTC